MNFNEIKNKIEDTSNYYVFLEKIMSSIAEAVIGERAAFAWPWGKELTVERGQKARACPRKQSSANERPSLDRERGSRRSSSIKTVLIS